MASSIGALFQALFSAGSTTVQTSEHLTLDNVDFDDADADNNDDDFDDEVDDDDDDDNDDDDNDDDDTSIEAGYAAYYQQGVRLG
eukprot:CAMPEP_0195018224 /NCGR_PEP_ID=MMETSP0326_2-20130528/29758_1 /TAXON_ID=2866 ORGANISM="Crypthecodinium cohnii, Strain Seligo" /NCGR_SAMPLE_ID=MMETSP0326_2 /ASSEMBLY_ACC=CAM_ASM_000348 /LENGTH=84 /DNA_ID=CAMNT_0040035519 /DNA_START=76 /DNA_END=330 /DNA_ORIENTATION=+